MEDLNDQKNYFSMELTRRGLIPVYMVIENQSGDDSFLFDKTAISFAVGITAGAGPDISSKSLQTLQVASALVISPVGIIVGAKLAKDEAAVQRNLVMKEVQSKTLSPWRFDAWFSIHSCAKRWVPPADSSRGICHPVRRRPAIQCGFNF